jgi:hypothetical protein
MRFSFDNILALILLLTASHSLLSPTEASESSLSYEALMDKADTHASAGRWLAALDDYEAAARK